MSSSSQARGVRIFLAHASEDKKAVIELYERLKRQGYKPWLDKINLLPGQKWREEIPKAIRNSDIFIACLSQRSVAKQGYIQREFRMALNKCADMPSGSIYLIPLRFDECEIPELRQEEYGISLGDYQWLDYFEEGGFDRLVKSITYHFSSHVELAPESDSSFQVDLGDVIELEMVKVPGGEFLMGSPEREKGRYESESPQHLVTVLQFWMGKYPVTQTQYRAVMGENPSLFTENGANRPVEWVSWNDAVSFCQRLSDRMGQEYRLPSEAEWEYACRAGTETSYYFGESISKEQVNCNGWYGQTTDVGRFPPNAFGLHDMHGNVFEWCLDHWHDGYEGAPTDGSAWLSHDEKTPRVIRGGSWADDPRNCRSAYRFGDNPGNRDLSFGFRVVCIALRALQ